MLPLVSVIIPTYKRPYFLRHCIDSVLKQSYKNIEIIIVDDNGRGTDFQKETESVLHPYIDSNQIVYVAHDVNRNGSAARNTGIKKSKGEYLIFLDDDDTLLPDMVSVQLKRLGELSSDYGAVYCNSIIKYRVNYLKFVRVITTKSQLEGNVCRDYLLGICRFNTSTILFKKTVIESLNGFDESFRRHQDYELMVRFFDRYKIGCSFKPLVLYDVTKDSTLRVNSVSDFEIKKQFFNERGNILKKMGIYNEVGHCFWNDCAINAYLEGNKKQYRECRTLSLELKKDTLKDVMRLNTLKMLYIIRHIFNRAS